MDLVMNDRIHDGTPDAEGSTCKISSSDLLVEVDNVTVRYMLPRSFLSTERRTLLALDRVSLSVARGQTLGIVGATGSGKSTIAKLIMGMISPTSGTVKVAGQDLASVSGPERLALQRLRQVVLQDPYSSLDPRMKVGSIIAEPLRHGPESRKLTRRAIRERVKELLLRVGMQSDKAELFPHQFSGGQRQRISIARALAPDPKLIVLDEPTSALDVSIRAQILNLLKDLQENLGVSYVIISHDLVTVAYLASTVAVMQRGRVIESGPTESIYRGARHPYTLELLASTPSASGEFLSVSDRPDDASSNRCPGGCLYADRCALRDDLGEPHRCLDEVPQLSAVTPDHFVACHFRDRDIVRNEQSGAAVDER